ncbi:hypothetical protein [Novosphingobium lentum]|uniref:hypothetical protein n=1 Tax=Novosphingobium lentum TaxID=145287 RepID=UPI00082E1A9B|nr:hypothetical protein [Novosphingobium lentum]
MSTEIASPEILVIAAASLIGLGVIAATLLRAWHDWLQLKRLEIEHGRGDSLSTGAPLSGPVSGMARIEMADLKERIRKLEAIASGVDL